MGDTKAPPRLRSRQCMFVLYPESQQAAIDYCKQNLPCAWALHDKDVYSQAAFDAYVKKHEGTLPDWMPGDLKKPHVHFVCSFANARYFSGIAKEIGVEVNVIRKVNNLYKAYVYLWHLPRAPSRHGGPVERRHMGILSHLLPAKGTEPR